MLPRIRFSALPHSFNEIVTPTYLDEIITSGRWTAKGDYLDKFIDCKRDEPGFPESLVSVDNDEAISTPEFRQYLHDWLRLRYTHVCRDLYREVSGFPLRVSRALHVSTSDMEAIVKGDKRDVGVHWGTGNVAAWGADPVGVADSIEILVDAMIAETHIDWVSTLRARFDFSNGDDECEIVIYEDAKPAFLALVCIESMEVFDLSRIGRSITTEMDLAAA